MKNSLESSSEKPQKCQLPALRAIISSAEELQEWRERLYRSMTSRSTSAVSRLLSEGLQVTEIMHMLNKRVDKTRKSKWATLQAIIMYHRGYTEKSSIAADDVRAELERMEALFSGKKTVKEILTETREAVAKAKDQQNEAFVTIHIAGFTVPIVGRMRETIMDLLAQSGSTTHMPPPEKNNVSEEKLPKKEPTPPEIPRPIRPITLSRGLPPPTINAAIQHQMGVRALQRAREQQPSPYKKAVSIEPPPASQQPSHHGKPHHAMPTTTETLAGHREYIIQHAEAQKIIDAAWSKSCGKGKHDYLVFENYIKGKDIEMFNILQAIKRLGRHADWEGVLEYLFGKKTPPLPSEIVATPVVIIPEPVVPSVPSPPKPPEVIVQKPKPPIPPKPTPKHVTPSTSRPTPHAAGGVEEGVDYETLALEILANPKWMAFLQPLCHLHIDRKYRDFIASWNAFQDENEDELQCDLWNALRECREAKHTPLEGVIHIAFELCGSTFTSQDGDLYTTTYNRRKRIPELLKEHDTYQDLIRDLEDIKDYQTLCDRMKNITLSTPLDADKWLLYEEKISPKYSLTYLVEQGLKRQYPTGSRSAERSVYLRAAKKIVRAIGHGK